MIESDLHAGGAVVFWSAAPHTRRVEFARRLTELGLGEFAPEARPETSILRDALEGVYGGPRTLVRPLEGRDGFAVVREERGRAGNLYRTEVVAKVEGSPPLLRFDPPGGKADRVLDAAQAHRELVPASQLSACLVRVVESLGGTRLRPTGAVYWVPGHKLAEWALVASAAEESSEAPRHSAVYVLRHRFDADAVRAVRDAVVAEVSSEAAHIAADVHAGNLGARALETRRKQAADLRAKVHLYEDLLSVGLGNLRAAVDSADQAAATAALLESVASDYQPAGAR